MANKKPSEPKPVEADPAAPLEADAIPDFARLHIWQIQAFRDVLVVAAVVGILLAGYALRAVTVPLLVALLLAYLFEPLISWMCSSPRLGLKRARAVTLLLLVVCGALLITSVVVIPLVIGETATLVHDVRGGNMRHRIARIEPWVPEAFRTQFMNFVDVLPNSSEIDEGSSTPRSLLPPSRGDDVAAGLDGNGADAGGDGAGGPAPETAGSGGAASGGEAATGERSPAGLDEASVRAIIREELDKQQAAETGTTFGWRNVAVGGVQVVTRLVGSVVTMGLLAFLIPFYFFFFSLWYPAVVRFGRSLIPTKNKARTLELLGKMDRVVSGFVRGRIVISILMGALLAIGWMICSVPYAIVVGIVTGIFCAVPYLGMVGVPVAVGLLFFDRLGAEDAQGLWWLWAILWPSVVFAIVQLIEGYVLTPLIAGKVTDLDPVTILVAVLAGGAVLGVYGMLLAIPVAACGKILFSEVLMPKVHAWIRGEAADPLPIKRT